MSDCHNLTYSVFESFLKQPRIIKYKDDVKFDNNSFKAELVEELSKSSPVHQFEESRYYAKCSVKEKHLTNNESTFMTKFLRMAIITRSGLS